MSRRIVLSMHGGMMMALCAIMGLLAYGIVTAPGLTPIGAAAAGLPLTIALFFPVAVYTQMTDCMNWWQQDTRH